jgi:hypothetical protein
MWSEPVQATL